MYVPTGATPVQLVHRQSVLDGYLEEDEGAVRSLDGKALEKRTVGVLRIYWWLWGMLRELQVVQERGWVGMMGSMEG